MFHVLDPIYFQKDIRAAHSQFGMPWNREKGFTKRADDWMSVAFLYQQLNGQKLPPIPPQSERIRGMAILPWEKDALEKMRNGTGSVNDF